MSRSERILRHPHDKKLFFRLLRTKSIARIRIYPTIQEFDAFLHLKLHFTWCRGGENTLKIWKIIKTSEWIISVSFHPKSFRTNAFESPWLIQCIFATYEHVQQSTSNLRALMDRYAFCEILMVFDTTMDLQHHTDAREMLVDARGMLEDARKMQKCKI